jgi:hypothetical protein
MRKHHMHMARHDLRNNLLFLLRKGIQDCIIIKLLTTLKFTKFGGILRTVTNTSEPGYISLQIRITFNGL